MKIMHLLLLTLLLLTGTACAEDIELRFTYGSEKKEWIKVIVEAFNKAGYRTTSGKTIKVVAVPMGSGECISGLLDGTDQAHLISPASDAFIKLGNARSVKANGKPLIGDTRNLVLSPVVIAMWEPMAKALGWPEKELGWHDILKVSQNPKGWAEFGFPEWGHFKFGHTHPEFSNSGLISVVAEIYAATGKQRGLTAADIASPETATFLSNVENSVVHYGESTGFFGSKMFERGPEYLSAAVLYENMVIESTSKKDELPFPVVAIYPKEGTFWSDHPVAIVDRPWVSAEHRRAAEAFITYMMAEPQQQKAMSFGFRPGNPAIKLTAPFDKEHGVDPLQPKTTLEVPSGELIEQSLALWKKCKKKANIVIVLDKSGSMKADGRMNGARDGAIEMLKMLNDKDSVSILSFDDQLGCRGEGDRDRRPVDFADVSGTNKHAGLEPMPAGAGKADSQQPPVAVGRRGNLLTIDARPGRIPTRLSLLPHRDQGAGVGIEIDRQLPSPLRPRQGPQPDGMDPHSISGPSAKGGGEDAIERLGNERRLAALLTAVSRPVPATEAGHDEHRE